MKKLSRKNYDSFARRNSIFALIVFVATLFLGIGYAQVSGLTLDLEGTAVAKSQYGLLITDAHYSSNVSADMTLSKVNTYFQTNFDSTVVLTSDPDSSITFQITILNGTDKKKTFTDTIYTSEFYDNNDISFSLSGLSPGDVLDIGDTVTFTITFEYANGVPSNMTLNSVLNFKFDDWVPPKTYWIPASDIRSKMSSFAGGTNNIKHFVRADEATYNAVAGTLTSNNVISTAASNVDTYLWYANNTIYYYTEAPNPILNASSNSFFSGYSKLIDAEVDDFDTSQVTSLGYFFSNCSKLQSLNLSNWNTENVKSLEQFLYNTNDLHTLDISSFNTSQVTNMASAFGQMHSLQTLDLRHFDTSKVTTMINMFNGSKGLEHLYVTGFDVSHVSQMSRMFASTEKLTELDLSTFIPSSATTMEKMFSNDYALETVYVSDQWVIPNNCNGQNMFINNTLMVGGNGTVFDANHVDKSYAVIDDVNSPGYFTRRNP